MLMWNSFAIDDNGSADLNKILSQAIWEDINSNVDIPKSIKDNIYEDTKNKYEGYKKAYNKYNKYIQNYINENIWNLLSSTKIAIKQSIILKNYITKSDYSQYINKVPSYTEKANEINKMIELMAKIKDILTVEHNIKTLIDYNNWLIKLYWPKVWITTLKNIDKKLTSFSLKLAKYDLFNKQYPVYDKYIKKFESYQSKYQNNLKISAIINIILWELKTFKIKAVYLTTFVQTPNKYAKTAYDEFKKDIRNNKDVREQIIVDILRKYWDLNKQNQYSNQYPDLWF